jgi:hypothetical protein
MINNGGLTTMRRLARVTLWAGLLNIGLLTGCDNTQSATASHLPYQTISYQKQGGKACPTSEWNADETALCASVKVLYPQLDDQSATSQTINRFITEEVLNYESDEGQRPKTAEELAQFFIKDYQQQPDPVGAWALERTMEVLFANEQLLTLKFSEMNYMGEAHPAMGQSYYTFNRQTGKPIQLSEVLNARYETELNVIGEKYFRENRNIPANQTLEQAGFEFKNGKFELTDNRGITQEGLVFYFNSYEIAPYAVGPTEITVPYSAIQNLIRPDGALAAFKH